jgi:azurin
MITHVLVPKEQIMRMLTPLFLTLALGAAGPVVAKTCNLEIEGNDAMQYNKKELTVAKDCTDVKLTLKHVGKLPKASMGHDWVLTATADMQAVVTAGLTAGAAADYLPKGDARVIAATSVVGGGEVASVTFKTAALKAGTEYKYFCTFPGHAGVMNGVLALR